MPVATSPSHDASFKAFRIFDVTYKVVDNHSIQTSVLVPKAVCRDPRPVIVRFHGGGLVSGSRLHAPWFPPYLLAYATAHSAIIVSPDYRLLPEACGLDILSDISSLWSWLLNSLHPYISLRDFSTPCGIDHTRIMVSGESAGGWLAIQFALMHPHRIKAILGIFPMLDLGDEHFTRGGRTNSNNNNNNNNSINLPHSHCKPQPTTPHHAPADRAAKANIMNLGFLLDASIIDSHIAAAAERSSSNNNNNSAAAAHPHRRKPVISSVTPPARLDLSLAVFQHGRLGELLGPERALYPLEVLEDMMTTTTTTTTTQQRSCCAGNAARRRRLPPLCIVHGTDDTVVPVQGSKRFAHAWAAAAAAAAATTWQQCGGKADHRVVVDVDVDYDGPEKEDRRRSDSEVVKLVLRPGEHGFEAKASVEEDGWLRNALGWVADRWLD